jgi:murein L,D-transpeptidase YafK
MALRCGVLRADSIVVNKARRELLLLSGSSILRSYRVAIGREPVGHKVQEGDGRTPEGFYTIDRRNPKSAFHLSLHISYPCDADRERARSLGVDPGGDIMIHGGRERQSRDQTQGCIAVTDAEIEEIWKLVPDGTPIEIRP